LRASRDSQVRMPIHLAHWLPHAPSIRGQEAPVSRYDRSPFTVHLHRVVMAALIVLGSVHSAAAQAQLAGEWTTLPSLMPINPIHAGLLRTGKVLVVAGSENAPTITPYRAALFDPSTGATSVQSLPWDLFCNALSFLPDGRALIVGGTLQYDPFR